MVKRAGRKGHWSSTCHVVMGEKIVIPMLSSSQAAGYGNSKQVAVVRQLEFLNLIQRWLKPMEY